MRSIRKFAYAAVLSLSMFSAQPTSAAAEEAHGSFTLSHEVHWQKSVLHAGDYAFTVKNMGSSQFLVVRGLNRTHSGAMMMVNAVDTPKPDETSRLVLVSRNGQSFVSSLALPEYEVTLLFAVPADNSARLVERASK